MKDNILLFDLGYFKSELFSKIRNNGGYFVSRLKQSANPTIVSVLRVYRENTIDIVGKKLKDILPQLSREVIDVEVEVSFKGSASKAKKPKKTGRLKSIIPEAAHLKLKRPSG